MSKCPKLSGCFGHQRHADGGRDAGPADHLHGHHAYVVQSHTVNMVKTHNPIKMPEADKEDAVLIAVTRDGKVFVSPGMRWYSSNELGARVKISKTNRTDKTVYLKGDASARFESVTDVIDTSHGRRRPARPTDGRIQDKKKGLNL